MTPSSFGELSAPGVMRGCVAAFCLEAIPPKQIMAGPNYPEQRRRREFFGVETPRQLKGYHAPPAWGPEAAAPPDFSEVSFCKTIESFIK